MNCFSSSISLARHISRKYYQSLLQNDQSQDIYFIILTVDYQQQLGNQQTICKCILISKYQIIKYINSKEMIQQPKSGGAARINANNPIKIKLYQMIKQEMCRSTQSTGTDTESNNNNSINRQQIQQFIQHLYQFQIDDVTGQEITGLQILALSILQYLEDSAQMHINQRDMVVIAAVILCMINQSKASDYQKGILPLCQILCVPKIRQLVQNILLQSSVNPIHNQLKTHLVRFLTTQNIQNMQSKLTENAIKSQKIKYSLGILGIIANLIWYGSFMEGQNLDLAITTLQEGILHIGAVSGKIDKTEIGLFVWVCFTYQQSYDLLKTQSNHVVGGYQLAYKTLIKIFQVDNLQKRLNCLQQINTILSSHSTLPVTPLLAQILQPRVHQQILSRSLALIKHWLESVNNEQQIKQILMNWFMNLILYADLRTSNLFSAFWAKAIDLVGVLGAMQVQKIYFTCVEVLQKFKQNPRISRIKLQEQKQKQSRVIKILHPVMQKRFQRPPNFSSQQQLIQQQSQFSNQMAQNERETVQFLLHLFQIQHQFSANLSKMLNQELKVSISKQISLQFNVLCLRKNIRKVQSLMIQYDIMDNDGNVIKIEEQITQIYAMIRCIIASSRNNPIQSQTQAFLNQIKDQITITNLILCHNTQNKAQLKQLLELITEIIHLINNHNFQKDTIIKTMKKVDNADQSFLKWMKTRLDDIVNMEFREKIITQLFKKKQFYAGVSLAGLDSLLSLLYMSDLRRVEREDISLQLLKCIKSQSSNPQIFSKQINQVLISLWSISQICSQHWLKQFLHRIQFMQFDEISQLQIRTQILRMTEEFDYIKIQNLYSENVPMQEDIQIRFEIQVDELGDRHDKISKIQKTIFCQDCLSYIKVQKNYIQPIINTQIFQNFAIDRTQFGQILIDENNWFHSLRKLQFSAYNKNTNLVKVFLKNKNWILIKKLKIGTISKILDDFYGQFVTTVDIIKICSQKQLKRFRKWIEKNIKSYNPESLMKQNLLSLILKLVYYLKNNQREINQKKNRNLINEFAEFLQQIDSKQVLQIYSVKYRQGIIKNGYSHRLMMSQDQYLMQVCLAILQQRQQTNSSLNNPNYNPNLFKNSNPNKVEKEARTTFELLKNPFQRFHQIKRIAYQMLNMLSVNKGLINYVGNKFGEYCSLQNLQNFYMNVYGFEVLWILLKSPQNFIAFIETGYFNSMVQIILKYLNLLLTQKQKIHLWPLEIVTRICHVCLRIWNKVFMVFLQKQGETIYILVTQKPLDLINLNQTKKHLESLGQKNIDAFFSEKEQGKQIKSVISAKSFDVNITQGQQTLENMILGVYQLMDINKELQKMLNKNTNLAKNFFINKDILLLCYEVSKFAVWMLIKLPSQSFVRNLIKFLRSSNSDLVSICKSVLYVYLKIKQQQNSILLIELLLKDISSGLNNKQNPNYQLMTDNSQSEYHAFYQILGQCLTVCKNIDKIEEVTNYLFTRLFYDPTKISRQKKKSLKQILNVIQKNGNKFSSAACETLLQIISQNYLFTEQDTNLKSGEKSIRKIIYSTILCCLKHHPSVQIQPFFGKINQKIKLANSLKQEPKQNDKGVGLENLGNICYMNSLMQMLHSVKPFVYQSCLFKSQKPIIYQLQRLFIQLSNTKNRYISPQQFVLSFQPPIDVSLQQDTTQFLANFLDKLETQDTTTKMKKLIQSLFKGKTTTKLQCSQCKKSKQRDQDYILYSLNIQNQSTRFKSLQQCFQNTKNPQILYDVNCDECKSKQKFLKTTKLKTIPPYFFIHLKRLVFDYNNPLVKVKIHTRLQFPVILQLHEKRLRLKAVITHQGTGEYGHYYTSVRQDNGSWLCYNDARVYSLSEKDKQQIWFGIPQGQNQLNYSTNAYLLLYELFPESMVEKQKNSQTVQNTSNVMIGSQNPTHTQLMSQIRQQNSMLLLKKLLLGQQYINDFTDFVFNLVKLPNMSNNYMKIYHLIAAISYPHNTITQIPASQYFESMPPQTEQLMQYLIKELYCYKQQNNQLIFHKNQKLRQFFFVYLNKIFGACFSLGGNPYKEAFPYACEILVGYLPLLKEKDKFVNSGHYTKLVGYLTRALSSVPQFIKLLYQNNTIQQVIQLHIQRDIQIQAIYNSLGIELIQSLLQLLLSFITLLQGSNDSIQNITEYRQNLIEIRKILDQEPRFIKLIFLSNSNFQYTDMLLRSLQLDNGKFTPQHLLGNYHDFLGNFIMIINTQIRNWNGINDSKSAKNILQMINYAQRYFSMQLESSDSFFSSVYGYIFPKTQTQSPNYKDTRINHLNNSQRNYIYLTNTLQQSLLEHLAQRLIKLTSSQIIRFEDIEILNLMIYFLEQYLKGSQGFANFLTLGGPLVMYKDYCKFILASIDKIKANIESNTSILVQNTKGSQPIFPSMQTLRQFLQSIQQYQQMWQPITIGQVNQQIQNTSSKLDDMFILVEDYDYYWAGYNVNFESQLVDYVDTSGMVMDKYIKDEAIGKMFKEVCANEKIEEQRSGGLGMNRDYNVNNQLQVQSSKLPQKHCITHRRIMLTNISDIDQSSAAISRKQITVSCQNMKNKTMVLYLTIKKQETRQIWVQKGRLNEAWGPMKIGVDGKNFLFQDRLLDPDDAMMENVASNRTRPIETAMSAEEEMMFGNPHMQINVNINNNFNSNNQTNNRNNLFAANQSTNNNTNGWNRVSNTNKNNSNEMTMN